MWIFSLVSLQFSLFIQLDSEFLSYACDRCTRPSPAPARHSGEVREVCGTWGLHFLYTSHLPFLCQLKSCSAEPLSADCLSKSLPLTCGFTRIAGISFVNSCISQIDDETVVYLRRLLLCLLSGFTEFLHSEIKSTIPTFGLCLKSDSSRLPQLERCILVLVTV